MSLKDKLTKAFRAEPEKARNSNQGLVQRNAELSLLYQLEQRRVRKLEDDNLALKQRIQDLMTEEDESRVRRLVADRTKRKLIQLKAITKRTISSLESGLNEFNEFIKDVDNAIDNESKKGALPMELVHSTARIDFSAPKFNPTLNRIPESPMLNTSDVLLNEIAANVDPCTSKLGENVDALMSSLNALEREENEMGELQTTSKQYDKDSEPIIPTSEADDKNNSTSCGSSTETSVSGSSMEIDSKKDDSPKLCKDISETEQKRDSVEELSTVILKKNLPLKTEVNPVVDYAKTTISTPINKREELVVVESTNAVSATVHQTNTKSDVCNTPSAPSADTSNIDFEDALSYTVSFNSAARNSSALDRSPSFIAIGGGTLRPLHTSTPKITRRSLQDQQQQPAASDGAGAIASASNVVSAESRDVFVPPRFPNWKKTSVAQRKTKITKGGDNGNVKPIASKANEIQSASPLNISPADVFLNPQATANVTARRNTNYSRYSDSFAASDTTVVDNTEKQNDSDAKDEDRTVVKKRNSSGAVQEAEQNEDDETFVGPPQQKRFRQGNDDRDRTSLRETSDHATTTLSNLTNVKVKASSQRDKAAVDDAAAKISQPDRSALSTTAASNNMSVSNVSENGRQRRAATLKVTSYKLPSIGTKLRRDF